MPLPSLRPQRPLQTGAAAVEFALVSLLLFTFVFGSMEVARALFLWSTLSEVVARAARMAAVASPADEAAVRHKAMFLTAANKLPLGGDIDESYLRIDYLTCDRATRASPVPSPMDNLLNCTAGPTAANCVRFVRVRLCLPGTDCAQVPYKPIVGLDTLRAFNIALPTFTTVVAADTLGLTPAN